jgi:uncharacterized protein
MGESLLAINIIVAVGSAVAALAGFGFALVTTPFLVLFLPPQQAIPLVMLCWLPLMVLLIRDSWRLANWRRYGLLAIGGAFGTPAGVWLLTHMSVSAARQCIGVITLLAAVSLWLKPSRPISQEKTAITAAGFVGGMMAGLSGMSGPPIVLLGLNQGWDHRYFRADLIHFFAINYLTALFWLNQAIGFEVQDGYTALQAIGGVVLGYAVGTWGRRFVSPVFFRRLAIGLVGVGGLLALLAP